MTFEELREMMGVGGGAIAGRLRQI